MCHKNGKQNKSRQFVVNRNQNLFIILFCCYCCFLVGVLNYLCVIVMF